MQEESRKIVSNTLIQIIGRIFVLALSLISIKLITNYLGTQGTGYYTTIVTYFSLFIVLADLGFFSVAVREISKKPEKSQKILANIFTIRVISAAIVSAIAVLVVFFSGYPAEIKYGVLVASFYPLFNLVSSIYDMLFQAKLEMQKVVIAEVLSRVVALIGIFIAIIYNLGFYPIIFTIFLSALTSFVVKAIFSRKELGISFGRDKDMMLWIMKMALPLGVVFIVNNLYFRVDTLILFYFKGATDVGIYSVAYRVLETTLFAGSYLASSLKPLFATSVEDNKEKSERMLSQSLTFLLFMALIVTTICISVPKEIILFLSNDQFVSGTSALTILGFATIFIYLSGVLGEIMIAKDMRKILLIISIFILAFNISLNMILIPRYSYIGAASATLISEIILFLLGLWAASRAVKVRLDYARIGKLILVAGLSVALSLFLKAIVSNFIVILIFNAGFYLSVSYLIDAIPRVTINSYLKTYKLRWQKK